MRSSFGSKAKEARMEHQLLFKFGFRAAVLSALPNKKREVFTDGFKNREGRDLCPVLR
jgi:hypothetical protein